MANWESKTVADVTMRINDDYLVLPVIQRRLVWTEDKMELLFDTLLKGNSFGGIMVLEEEKGNNPLFEYRSFSKDGSDIKSMKHDTPLSHEQYFVIDGQQRLQTFYIGLTGSIHGKELFFNLNSDYENLEFDFRFSNELSKLPKEQKKNGETRKTNIWYPIKKLFERSKKVRNRRQVTSEIINNLKFEDNLKGHVEANIEAFYEAVFNNPTIGVSKVIINSTLNEIDNKQRIVELFRRLNDGGTRLSSYELVASIFKGFNWEMEAFLEDLLQEYDNIGIGQDELIKLIFILQDNHRKEILNVSAADAEFAIKNKIRIKNTLSVVKRFLINGKLYDYYRDSRRSVIPLYFVAYSIFHQDILDKDIISLFDKHDVKVGLFDELKCWLYFSLINGVFRSRGAGWIAYKTGIMKILGIVKNFKNKDFPVEDIFNLYRSYLHFFVTNIAETDLDKLDQNFLFYLIYDRQRVVRNQDVDHIHPKNILENAKIEWDKINSICNFQLLDSGTNQGEKNGKELNEWISNYIEDTGKYVEAHLIPYDSKLWDSSEFHEFLNQRSKLILKKINSILPHVEEENHSGEI